MCLCYLFNAKTARQLVNRNADFFRKRIDSNLFAYNEWNRIDSNRELECSTGERRWRRAETAREQVGE